MGVLKYWDGTQWRWQDVLANFLGLSDTPVDYNGHGGKAVNVNATEDGLEFVESSGGDALASQEDDLSDLAHHRAGPELPRADSPLLELVDLVGSGFLVGGDIWAESDSDLPWHVRITVDGSDPVELSPQETGDFSSNNYFYVTKMPPVRFESSLLVEVRADRGGTGMNDGSAWAWTRLD